MKQQSIPERLQDHLEPGERVLWIGAPSPRLLSLHSLLEIVGPSLLISFVLGGGLFLLLTASGDLAGILEPAGDMPAASFGAGLFWLYFLSSLVLMGVVAPALVVMIISALNWSRKRGELYAITDRGFLWQRSVWLFSRTVWPVHRFPLDEVNALEVRRHADGTGTITFLDVSITLDADASINPSFARIADVDLALAIAYAAAEEAGVPQPEQPTAWQVMGQAFKDWLGCSVLGAAVTAVACLGASTLFSSLAAAQRWDLEGVGRPWLVPERVTDLSIVAVVLFVTGFLGLWSMAVSSRLRRHPHLHRLRRLLVWLRVAVALAWLGGMAWVVLALVA